MTINTNYILRVLENNEIKDEKTIEFFTNLNSMYNSYSYNQLLEYKQELIKLKPSSELLYNFNRLLDMKLKDNEFFKKYPNEKPEYYNNA